MTNIIEVESLVKQYNGSRGLDGFTLRVPEGTLFGLVGPNGAGKSTLIKILATLLRPSSGYARIAGFDTSSEVANVRRVVGYMPDQPGLYQEMRIREFLQFFAAAFRIPADQRPAAVSRALEFSGLAPRANSFVEELSFGMKQRLVLAKTLLHQPRVLLLDEPATGLDPMARIELREQLKALNTSGVTILVSSHILSDLEDICTHVALISDGKNAQDHEGNSILSLQGPKTTSIPYEVQVLSAVDAAEGLLRSLPNVQVLAREGQIFRIAISGGQTEAAKILAALAQSGAEIALFQPAAGLEDRYRAVFSRRPQ
jgi:ABC-2 type transport system ATP-binding protein